MKLFKYIVVLFAFVFICFPCHSHAGFDDFLKEAKGIIKENKGLSQDDIINGLKDALRVGAVNAVKTTGTENGFYKHPVIKIPLPEQIKKVEKILRNVGYGSKLDELKKSMNRAAEHAVPKAELIFINTIKEISFSDARKILKGRDNEATLYFKEKTSKKLYTLFDPIIHKAMKKVGVTKRFHKLNDKLSKMPFTEKLQCDLDDYVTRKALDGLFYIMAKEEKKIRKDPKARVTDILKKVFETS